MTVRPAKRRWTVISVGAVLAMVALGCGAKGVDNGTGDAVATPTTVAGATDGGAAKFGTLDSPCGKAPDGTTVKIAAGEDGGSASKLRLGIASDKTSDIRPGLLKEFYDTGVAFTEWCNAQGGIAGLPIELVDLDGKLLSVEAAMTTACTGVFAMVGGGFAQDNLVFSGKDGSDFHKCKLIAFTGFAVTTDFAEANGVIQPIPNPAYKKANTFWHDLQQKYPDEVKKTAAVYGDVPSLRVNKDGNKAVAATVPGFNYVVDIPYNPITQDWSLIAQQVVQEGVTAVNFVGEPEGMSGFVSKLKDQNWKGVIFADANQYDPKLFSAGPDLAAGVVIRLAAHMFEEADEYPAIKEYVDIMGQDPSRKIAALGIQGWSAWLLFATSVNKCIEKSGGEISRKCVIEAGKTVTSWDGGGLHAETNPGENLPPACSMGAVAEKGAKFGRLFPKKGDPTYKDGFSCRDDAIVSVTGDLGKGNVDPSLGY